MGTEQNFGGDRIKGEKIRIEMVLDVITVIRNVHIGWSMTMMISFMCQLN